MKLNISTKEDVKKKLKSKISLETEENMVYSCLDLYPKNVNQVNDGNENGDSQLINQHIIFRNAGIYKRKYQKLLCEKQLG